MQKHPSSQFTNKELKVIYEPVGVCGFITPWNFPLAMATRKTCPGIGSRMCCHCKTKPWNPFSFLLLAKTLPTRRSSRGTVNIVVGPEKEIGNALLDSPSRQKNLLYRKHPGMASTCTAVQRRRKEAYPRARGKFSSVDIRWRLLDQAIAGRWIQVPQCRAYLRLRQPHLYPRGIYAPLLKPLLPQWRSCRWVDPFDERPTSSEQSTHLPGRKWNST